MRKKKALLCQGANSSELMWKERRLAVMRFLVTVKNINQTPQEIPTATLRSLQKPTFYRTGNSGRHQLHLDQSNSVFESNLN